jgi:hypothetical protein
MNYLVDDYQCPECGKNIVEIIDRLMMSQFSMCHECEQANRKDTDGIGGPSDLSEYERGRQECSGFDTGAPCDMSSCEFWELCSPGSVL